MCLMKLWPKSSQPKEGNRFLGAGSVCMHSQLCPTLLRPPCIVAHQAPLSRIFPIKNTGVCCHSLPQGIVPIQESKPCLLHCRQILYHPNHQVAGSTEDPKQDEPKYSHQDISSLKWLKLKRGF